KMSIQSPAKCEIRSVIRYLVWKEKTPVEVYNEVKTAYGDKGMNRTSVFKWCREFKNGRTSVHDDQRSGRPSILTDDIVEKIENALRDDRRLTVDELSAMFPQISRSLLHETITETLGYWKLSARWIPKQLTDQHKLNRVEAGQEFLRRYKLHGDEFLRSIVTGDDFVYEVRASIPCKYQLHLRACEGNHSFRGIQRTSIHAEHVALAPRGRIIDEWGRENGRPTGKEVEDERSGYSRHRNEA
ncbi:SETMR methyltransferase, partial [Pseudoatta argentina]